jgi:DNA-binding NtrC family response regulator
MEGRKILIVDDEPEVLESLSAVFLSRGFKVLTASSGAEALEVFSQESVPVIVCDNSLPDIQGTELFNRFRDVMPEVQVIMVTGKGTVDIAVAAMKAGMFDFITKPPDPEHLIHLAVRAQQLYDALTDKKTLIEEFERMAEKFFIGKSPAVTALLRLLNTVAPTDSTVLIEGESGTGKELVARLVHQRSQRASGPFVAVDCGAIPEGLVESELFGHEKGAFTGASALKVGRFERAHKGTLFLDEITNLPLGSQAKLLRALQEKVIERVGGQRAIPVNIRLVAATNRDLREAVNEKSFREDLFYRLNIVKLKIPPLRERKSDIPVLALHFMEKHRDKAKGAVTGMAKNALTALMDYSWPGNVRELENAIEHALIMAGSSQIRAHDLPPLAAEQGGVKASRLDEAERDLILKAIKDAGGNKNQAAKALGIPRSSLYSKLKKLGIAV